MNLILGMTNPDIASQYECNLRHMMKGKWLKTQPRNCANIIKNDHETRFSKKKEQSRENDSRKFTIL